MLILHDFAIVFFDIPTHRPFGNYRPPRAQKKGMARHGHPNSLLARINPCLPIPDYQYKDLVEIIQCYSLLSIGH